MCGIPQNIGLDYPFYFTELIFLNSFVPNLTIFRDTSGHWGYFKNGFCSIFKNFQTENREFTYRIHTSF